MLTLSRPAVLEWEAELAVKDDGELALALQRGEEVVGSVALRRRWDVEQARRERRLRAAGERSAMYTQLLEPSTG